MGAGGADIQMASATKRLFPYKIECKNLAAMAVYSLYAQACSHKESGEPLLVIKQNRSRPLVVLDAEFFFNMHRPKTDEQTD